MEGKDESYSDSNCHADRWVCFNWNGRNRRIPCQWFSYRCRFRNFNSGVVIMYQFFKSALGQDFVKRIADNAFIPVDPANTDYAEFKKAVTTGAELQDADGNVMTEQAAQEFIRTLP